MTAAVLAGVYAVIVMALAGALASLDARERRAWRKWLDANPWVRDRR